MHRIKLYHSDTCGMVTVPDSVNDDPTRAELLDRAELHLHPADDPDDSAFDVEQAIYWFACNYHGGQNSNLYSVLSSSEYRPGANESGPDGLALDIYTELVDTFAPWSDEASGR